MGSTLSTPEPLSFEQRGLQPCKEDEQDVTWKQEEQQVERDRSLPIPLNTSPASYASVQEEFDRYLPNNRILYEHMTPGLLVSTAAPSEVSISGSVLMPSDNDKSRNDGTLRVSKIFGSGEIDIRANTLGSLNVSACYFPTSSMRLHGMLDASGSGRVACDMRPNPCEPPHLLLGSCVDFQSPSKFTTVSDVKVTDVRGHAGVHLPCHIITGLEATIPVETMEPKLSYHLAARLRETEKQNLLLSMHKSPTGNTIALTSVFKNERTEDKTFACTMEMEVNKSQRNLTMGLDWSINRALGAKIVATPSKLTGAVVLKKLEEPRMTCSVIFGLDSKKAGMQGIGLEVGA